MPARRLVVLIALLAALPVGAVILVQAASAWSLNRANASIVRAASLPSDAPARGVALEDAQMAMEQSRRWGNLDRVALARARTLLLSGDPGRAAQAFSEARPFVSDAMAEFVWGDAAWQAGQIATAVEHWQAAGALTYFMQQAHRAVDAHDWSAAAEQAAIAVRIAPNSAEAHYVLADAMSRLAPDTPAVFDELDRALALTTDNEFRSTILSRKGEILASQGELEQARDLFAQARHVAPIDARPRTGYALVLVRLEPAARSEAIALLTEVVGDSPWYTAAYIALADLAESGGDTGDAVAWLQRGLERNPNDARLLLALGDRYARRHMLPEARAALVSALRYETHADALQEIAQRLATLAGPGGGQ